ncbi:putative Paraflagellar rod protein [Trypanosoma vivax]|nr:putative Paraflagellar rod protein [Trypanosoma vivax]
MLYPHWLPHLQEGEAYGGDRRNIRTTHIQLEFCVETFDPNAKKHADMKKELYKLRQGVEEELAMLKEKQSKALEDFKETEEALDAAGIEFNHPVDENNEEVLTRRSKMVEYRSHLTKQEEVKIAAEREEIKRARLLRTAGAGAGAGAGAEQHRIGDNTAPAV